MDGNSAGTAILLALVPIVSTLFVLGIVLVLVLTFTSGSRTPLPMDPRVPVTLQAWLMPADGPRIAGHWREEFYGTVQLENGWFLWRSNHGENWAVAVQEIQVGGVRGAFSFTHPGLDLMIRGASWRLRVSDKRINRFSRNDAKRHREARRAREFAALLHHAGAR